jgi:hypothetical protein
MSASDGLPHLGETRKETVSQGGGVAVSLSGGGEQNEQESANSIVTTVDLQGTGKGRRAARGWAAPAAALPCLDTFNCNERRIANSKSLSTSHAKAAFALKENCLSLVHRYGLERIGFLTLTFARHVVGYKEAQKALHSLMTGILKKRYPEYIIVMERMNSGRIHYHLLVVVAQDIRTGFDFPAVNRGNYRSANDYLRLEWKFWRQTAPRYGFGRTELLPIKKTADGIAKYVGKYIAKHIGKRLPEDKGARLVRYSRGTNRVSTRFSWNSLGANMWRAKLGTFCGMFGLNSDNYTGFLSEWFGRNWVYDLRPLMLSIKLADYHSAQEYAESLVAVWVAARNERQRRHGNTWLERIQKIGKPCECGA